MKRIRLFQSIQAKLIIIYVLLILIAMQLIGVYFVKTLENYFKTDFIDSADKQASLLAGFVAGNLTATPDSKTASGDGKKANSDLNEVLNLFALSNSEVQIIDANGIVLTTSQPNHQSLVGQKNTQMEVIHALQGIRDNQRMFTDTDNQRKMVLAKPVSSGGKVVGAVYVIASMQNMYDTMNRINGILISGTLIALGLTAMLGVVLSGTITSPIKEITKQATAIAEGNFSRQLAVRSHDEIGQLSHTFNMMMKRLREALSLHEEEKEKLASILANMNDGVIAANEKGQIILMNRPAEQILGIAEQSAVGQSLFALLGIPEDETERYQERGSGLAMLELERGEEEPLHVRVTFTSPHYRGDGLSGTIAVLQDVTEQEKLERSRREFVANVSHELRTPLTTIRSYLEALEDGAVDDPQLAHRFIGVTRSETERMIRLVTDLLHLSRLDSKQAMIAKEWTSVPDMLEEVADRFSFQLQQKQIEIAIEISPGIEYVMLDRDKIDQVLDNLVSNAIKYTPDNGAIRIDVSKTDGPSLEVTVSDTGIGIPKKDLARIFERFYRVDKARSRNMGGTGLGLSIAREIIKAHGGTITLDSELGKGTIVTFTLPMQGEEHDAV
ncbi:histidine kinase [Gordoniibacillus kamchatkensis]|uniref:histidine kinase n=1 Tax=Gordoniibacillus kamchatkensis TaxID=1590651 RepID=A0ABR5AFX7_9BACL|nr:cell wall metabolism sensor histidine kinase WalK [Paenibacillus sp. VKM B-2647]KIL39603.1 histidine kinase [Paenibacillus sp. VKM B-2647]